MSKRSVKQIIRGQNGVDGAGVKLRRVVGIKDVENFDPFLMLDGFDSTDPADYINGFPWHPHRGIETVTYLVKGKMEHGDSLGNRGIIGEMECQWMTAGSGIIHQEMPLASDRMLGCQLWVNLPAEHKMTQPAYRDISEADAGRVEEEDVLVRIISGEYKGVKGAFTGEYVKVQYLDVDLKADKVWEYNETANDKTLFIYLLEGSIAADENLSSFEEKACAILFGTNKTANEANDKIVLKAGAEGARFLLIAGRPLKEPVAWGGPVVMNTREELDLAFDELDDDTFIKHQL